MCCQASTYLFTLHKTGWKSSGAPGGSNSKFSDRSSKTFFWQNNNKQISLFNIYLSKGNSMCLKTHYCLKFWLSIQLPQVNSLAQAYPGEESLSQVVTWPAVTRVLSQSNRENNGNEVGMIFSLNFLNIYMCIPKCSINYFLGQCMNMFFGLVLHMYAFFFINFSLERFFLYVLCQPRLTFQMVPLLNIIIIFH